METIIKITSANFRTKDDFREFEGFEILTNKQTIQIGIQNGQACCETWGYFMSEDNVKEFEGSELLNVSLTDTALNTKKMEETELREPECMFVNFDTSKGVLQFVAYNSHNGYYGHSAIIISEKLNYSQEL